MRPEERAMKSNAFAVAAGLGLVACVAGASAQTPASATPPLDLVIEDARVVDGTGNPWYRADVGLRGDTIAAIGVLKDVPAVRRIAARGMVVAPGFIDVSSGNLERLTSAPHARNVVLQGVTTLIDGNDGMSPFPVADFVRERTSAPASVNVGTWIGAGSVRKAVMDRRLGRPTPDELERMRALVREAMGAGAFGLSSGLEPGGFHEPGHFADETELVALAAEAARAGGIYITHLRSEQAGIVDAVREALRIGEQARIPVQITHHKITGRPNWGLSSETLRLVDEARRRGLDVTLDQFPYTHVGVGISQFFPPSLLQAGASNIPAALRDPAVRSAARAHIAEYLKGCAGAEGLASVRVRHCNADASLAGKRLTDLAARGGGGGAPSAEDVADVLLDLQPKSCAGDIVDAVSEEDLRRILVAPYTMIASDAPPETDPPVMDAPKTYGTFARILARYVRETGVLSLEEAVRKMTSFPAGRLGIADRGLLRPGLKADLVVFDPGVLRDVATIDTPLQYAVGMVHVFVNGVSVVDGGQVTGRTPGTALRSAGARQRQE
jgi:dihydroorotase/N-acyl-D-amino-acid deacylase